MYELNVREISKLDFKIFKNTANKQNQNRFSLNGEGYNIVLSEVEGNAQSLF